MESLRVSFPNGETIDVRRGTAVGDLLMHFNEDESRILAVRINNEVCPLDMPIAVNCHVESVRDDSKDGSRVYRRSACLLLACAAHRKFPNARLLCGHSLSYGYYYTLETDGTFLPGSPSGSPHSTGSGTLTTTLTISSAAAVLEKEMHDLVSLGVSFKSELLSYADAIDMFNKLLLTQAVEHLKYTCPSSVIVNCVMLGDEVIFSEVSFGPVVPSSQFLNAFALRPHGRGFVLRVPRTGGGQTLPPFTEQAKLFEVYCKYKDWGRRVGVTNAAELNRLVATGQIHDFIEICETFSQRQFADVADQIVRRRGVRVVLLAGPSSSGKTTSAKKLALELEAIGYSPKVISLDCYYRGHDKTPRDKDGNLDFECLEALDVDLINDNLLDLFAGKRVEIPCYDFGTGSRYYDGKYMTLGPNDILIMEGIHALNDALTARVPRELKFKLYMSALTQINLDDHNRVSTSDDRLIRRIVRDNQFRGKDARGTIAMWPKVQEGERLHIFPFQDGADAMVNTALDYELSVLKVYAAPLLRCVSPLCAEYSEARRLLAFLGNFAEVDSSAVPARSILREFIGGSAFHY